METNLSLLLSQMPSCWQGSLVVHLSFSEQIGIYPSDFFEFCILLKFAFIDVFLAMLEYSIEPNSHVMAQYFFYFFFSSLPLREFPSEHKFLLARKIYAKAQKRYNVLRETQSSGHICVELTQMEENE